MLLMNSRVVFAHTHTHTFVYTHPEDADLVVQPGRSHFLLSTPPTNLRTTILGDVEWPGVE